MKKVFKLGTGCTLVGAGSTTGSLILIQLSEPLRIGQDVSLDSEIENEVYRAKITEYDELEAIEHIVRNNKSFYMNVNSNVIIDARIFSEKGQKILLDGARHALSGHKQWAKFNKE
ncbi:hypothetical protein LC76P1_00227 [Lysinibacillus phage LC76P1]|nr:hypothetical protein LC76P1_00227 [Lysinibacillus phage LC76P1]